MNNRDDSDVLIQICQDRFHFDISFPSAVSWQQLRITEAIEVDSKLFKFTLPQAFEVKVFQCYTCVYK